MKTALPLSDGHLEPIGGCTDPDQ